jgi:hypothetical protein
MPLMVLVLVAVLAAATLAGALWRRNAGRLKAGRSSEVLTSADLGEQLGRRATLLQFSTAVCQPCRVARGMLGGIAAAVDGVTHVEIDAERRLDLVRRLNVIRTPTVLVLDGHGRIVSRAAGAPRRADVLASVEAVVAAQAGSVASR